VYLGIYRIEVWGAKAGDSKDKKGGNGSFMGANFQIDEDRWILHYRCGGMSRRYVQPAVASYMPARLLLATFLLLTDY